MDDTDRKTILLVEDETLIAMAETMTLEDYGYRILLADSGEKALDIVRTTRGIDLILMDINLGKGMDGTEAAVKILERHKIPLIFLSSHTEREIVEKTEGITSYGYIVKNAGETVLLASIRMAFKLHEAHLRIEAHSKEVTAANKELQTAIEDLSRSQVEIMEREKQYRDLVENINDVIYTLAPDGTITYMSPMAYSISGYTPEELIGKNFIDFVHPEDIPGLMESYAATISGRIEPYEYRIIIRDGSERYVRTSSRMTGSPEIITGVMTDISIRKRIEDELKAKTELLDIINDNMSDLVSLADLNGNYTFAGKSHDILGYEPGYLIGKNVMDFVHPDDLSRVMKEFEEGMRLQEKRKVEYRYRLADGSYLWFESEGKVLRDEYSNPAKLIFSTREITTRKKNEDDLRESETRFKALHNASFGGIAIHDKGKILDCNQGLSEITGYSFGELVEMDGLLLIAEKSREMVMNNIISGHEKPYEATGVRKNREEYPLRLEARNIPYRGKNVRVVEFRDITEQKKAEDKIQNLLQEKELLLREIHHRVKNNLGTVMSMLSLQADTVTEPSAVAALRDATGRTKSMAVLYDRLFRSQNLREISTGDYISSLVDEIISMFPNRGMVKTRKRIDDFLLSISTLSPLGIIINELLTNAMKYAFTGRSEGMINVSLTKNDGMIRLIVEDNGIGLPGDAGTDNPTGFGLTLVGMLSGQLGGELRIEREQGAKYVLEFDAGDERPANQAN